MPRRGTQGKKQIPGHPDIRDSPGAALSFSPKSLSLQLHPPPPWVPSSPSQRRGPPCPGWEGVVIPGTS